jgi:glycosyltransferase involved in cell wall biosynthesis
MKISIGILAHNEERSIGGTLDGLGRQTLLQRATRAEPVDVHVVVNGARDKTASVAEVAANRRLRVHAGVTVSVDVLEQAGKANAWNHYIHTLSARDAGILILLDADIRFGEVECLERLVAGLMADPEAQVAVDRIRKDIETKADPSLVERMSVAASEAARAGPPKLAGSLYAGRADVLRRIWMPLGLLVEDGYLKAMVLTNSFRGDEDLRRLIRVPDTSHSFEAVTSPAMLFRHEKRLVTGTRVNIALFAWLRELAAAGTDAATEIRARNAADPGWLGTLARERLTADPALAPTSLFVLLPLRQLRQLRPMRALACLPGAVARSVFNVAVVAAANGDLRRGQLRW